MRLTEKTVPTLTIPSGKSEIIVFDDEVAGWGLRLRQGGSKTWCFQYKLGSKQRRMTFGAYPAMPPKMAREQAVKLHAQTKLGGDPAATKAEAKRPAITFGDEVRLFLSRRRMTLRPRSYGEVERYLLAYCERLHGLPLAQIDRRAVADLLAVVEQERGAVARNRCRSTLSAFFAWLVMEGRADVNPVTGTAQADEGNGRSRILSDAEIAEIWSAASGQDHFSEIVKLLLLLAARRTEIGGLQWRELGEVDGGPALVLPPSRVKNKREFILPLSPPAYEIIARQPRRVDRDAVFGFGGSNGFSGWSASKALLDSRILDNRRARDRKAAPLPQWGLHDLRRSAATHMADKLGVMPHVVEAVLNHQSGHKSGDAGIYNHARYLAPMREALTAWGDYVTRIAA